MLFGRYIKRRGLEELRNYKYASAGYTLTDKILNYWWESAVKLVPQWVAPNVLTLIGFFCALLAFLLVLINSPTFTRPAPRWLCLAVALLTFLHQTFDALDGKQARRTGTSSPLGQLFDHGCDVMLVTTASLTTIGITCCGTGLMQYAVVVVSTQIHQFIYMWWEYHYHVFYAATGPVGVTEAQLGMIVCSVVAGICGPEIFGADALLCLPPALRKLLADAIPFFPKKVEARVLLMVWLIAMNSVVAVYDILLGVYRAKRKLLATAQIVSLAVFQYAQWLFYKICLLTESQVASETVYLVMSSTYSILVLRLCLSATCKIPFSPIQWPLFPFYVAVGLLHCNALMEESHLAFMRNRTVVIVLLCLWNSVYLLDLLITSVVDICSYLGISCFVIPHKPTKKTS